jgi:hypothetical protein
LFHDRHVSAVELLVGNADRSISVQRAGQGRGVRRNERNAKAIADFFEAESRYQRQQNLEDGTGNDEKEKSLDVEPAVEEMQPP